MKNILIIPSNFITNIESRFFYKTKNIIKSFIKFDSKKIIENMNAHNLCAENYHYEGFADFKNLNVYMLGEYYPEYIEKIIPKFSRYPSMHRSKLNNYISINEVINNIKIFDCIIFGSRVSKKVNKILSIAKKNNILRVLVDHFDDQNIYFSNNYENYLYDNFKFKNDFDLMFKHDLPKDCDLENIYPICPMPIRKDNYFDILKPKTDKILNISFSGRVGHNNSTDREFFQDLLENYENSNFMNINFKQKISVKSYLKTLSSSKIAVSPYGKVWDSTRHSEIAIYNCLPIIPKPNCKLSDGIEVNDENSINYELNYDDKTKKFKILDEDILKDKIQYYLNNENLLKKNSLNWSNMINKYNSFGARANFILKKIKSYLKC